MAPLVGAQTVPWHEVQSPIRPKRSAAGPARDRLGGAHCCEKSCHEHYRRYLCNMSAVPSAPGDRLERSPTNWSEGAHCR
eukprot:5298263-Prymnesium_polylepis.1